ncbi:MAG: LysM peptidoglycan-binding domain-containing protein [Verrucomicrobia bacterium]|nr:LysM peptidoglycan-binding domain-containing protein [Verrucomicrobiota bacterium]MDE3047035.1 LysM peptidoglycan-binding domain-containing protein [Verrucomicrobiota bacterium]
MKLPSCALLLLAVSCTPLKSSPNDERHQLELTVREVQTNLDDLRHDINCFQTELQILDGRIKYYENTLAALKQHDLEKQQTRIEQLSVQIQALEKKWLFLDKNQGRDSEELGSLSAHANETTAALAQFKDRIGELEKEIYSHNRKFDEFAKLQKNIEALAKGVQGDFQSYRVKPGDSLEKIAKSHKTSVDKIKKSNSLAQDLIVVGQELKIPVD